MSKYIRVNGRVYRAVDANVPVQHAESALSHIHSAAKEVEIAIINLKKEKVSVSPNNDIGKAHRILVDTEKVLAAQIRNGVYGK